MTHRSPGDATCPVCDKPGEWMEEHATEIEFGCVNNHTWMEPKDSG